eukprot:gene14879-20008_t
MSEESSHTNDDKNEDNTVENNEGLNVTDWNGIDVMTSLCMSCGENGVTRFMLHRIPFFRELILASFACEHCGERNNEVTFGGEIQIQGSSFELKVTTARDLDRQLVKSDSASVRIRELDFEIPPHTQKGEISTIEGILKTAAKNLSYLQAERMSATPEIGAKVADVILNLTLMSEGLKLPFHVMVDDPAGNSFLQNPYAPQNDANLVVRHYNRTAEQDISLGLQPDKGVYKDDKESNFASLINGRSFGAEDIIADIPTEISDNMLRTTEDNDHVRLGRSEVISIPSCCPNCSMEGESLTALTDIPHFKEVIIMAFDCKFCGFRNNEVKGGGAVPENGTQVKLRVSNADDLKRDLLKSDSAMVMVPELDLELQHGTLGGVFTTVEGLLNKIHKSLMENNPFAVGDSTSLHHSNDPSVIETRRNFSKFLEKLLDLAQGKVFPFHIILRDPLGNSFISAPLGSFLPPESDINLEISDFERSFEE